MLNTIGVENNVNLMFSLKIKKKTTGEEENKNPQTWKSDRKRMNEKKKPYSHFNWHARKNYVCCFPSQRK